MMYERRKEEGNRGGNPLYHNRTWCSPRHVCTAILTLFLSVFNDMFDV